MFVRKLTGELYDGDMTPGDRVAIIEEINGWRRAQQPTPQQQIDAIERQTLMNRATREFMIALAEKEAAAAGYAPAQLYVVNLGYQKIKDVDNQIVALRSQISP